MAQRDDTAGKIRAIVETMKETGEYAVIVVDEGVVESYPLSIDYETDLSALVSHYDGVNEEEINKETFPTTKRGRVETTIELVHFGHDIISTKSALYGLNSMGLHPAELHEVLTLGIKYPKVHLDIEKKYPYKVDHIMDEKEERLHFCVAALGSSALCARERCIRKITPYVAWVGSRHYVVVMSDYDFFDGEGFSDVTWPFEVWFAGIRETNPLHQ